jgi:hypothetical protein
LAVYANDVYEANNEQAANLFDGHNRSFVLKIRGIYKKSNDKRVTLYKA